jgi:hypothetical protein
MTSSPSVACSETAANGVRGEPTRLRRRQPSPKRCARTHWSGLVLVDHITPWVCASSQSWTGSPGLTVVRFSADFCKCPADSTAPEPGVLEGTSMLCRAAQPGGVLAADSCGCGSAGGGTHGVPHRVALHAIRQHAAGAVGGVARGRARRHPARGPGPSRAGEQARGTPLCWGGTGAHRPVGVSAQVLGEAWTRLSAGTGSGRCSRGGRW